MYVRALYDYTADDPTSLSFRQDDVIQVLTQLDSGWWDGIIRGVRGWFPSNYCAPLPASTRRQDHGGDSGSEDADLEIDIEDEFEDGDPDRLGGAGASGKAAAHTFQEEAAFWIPQATPDGRLFYFNTLTGDSTMELPLESPTVANENGPRDSTNAFAADPAKPPPELMAAGYEREEESENEQSASENEEPLRLRGVLVSREASTCPELEAKLAILGPETKFIHVRWRVSCDINGVADFSIVQITSGLRGFYGWHILANQDESDFLHRHPNLGSEASSCHTSLNYKRGRYTSDVESDGGRYAEVC